MPQNTPSITNRSCTSPLHTAASASSMSGMPCVDAAGKDMYQSHPTQCVELQVDVAVATRDDQRGSHALLLSYGVGFRAGSQELDPAVLDRFAAGVLEHTLGPREPAVGDRPIAVQVDVAPRQHARRPRGAERVAFAAIGGECSLVRAHGGAVVDLQIQRPRQSLQCFARFMDGQRSLEGVSRPRSIATTKSLTALFDQRPNVGRHVPPIIARDSCCRSAQERAAWRAQPAITRP